MAMALTNPNTIAPMLVAEDGIFTRVIGEALYSYKCKEVSSQVIEHETCTNKLPVNIGGKLRYMEPITRILLKEDVKRTIMKCIKLLAPLHRLAPD